MGRGSSKAQVSKEYSVIKPNLGTGRETNASKKVFSRKLQELVYAVQKKDEGDSTLLNNFDLFEDVKEVKLSTLKGLNTAINNEKKVLDAQRGINIISKDFYVSNVKGLNEMQKIVNNYYKKNF